MINRATTGQTADKMSAVCFQRLDAAFILCVLIAADDHRVLVLPQVEDAFPGLYPVEQQLFQGQIVAGVGLPGMDHI